LQIWLLPARRGLPPSYEQKSFSEDELRGRWRCVASPDGAEGSVTIHTNASVHAGRFDQGESATFALSPERFAWVHVARGTVLVQDHELRAGDAMALAEEREVRVQGKDGGEVLLFDLA